MSQRGSVRPSGTAGGFLTFNIHNNTGNVYLTYTTSGFGAGWHVQVWKQQPSTGALYLQTTSANATETELNLGIGIGSGAGWYGELRDPVGELVARSAVTIL